MHGKKIIKILIIGSVVPALILNSMDQPSQSKPTVDTNIIHGYGLVFVC